MLIQIVGTVFLLHLYSFILTMIKYPSAGDVPTWLWYFHSTNALAWSSGLVVYVIIRVWS